MRIVAVSLSKKKGEKKENQPYGILRENFGLEGDVHADGTHRQLSLLAVESINAMRKLGCDVYPGDFAENLTTEGVCLHTLPVGTRFRVGEDIELELTQIGKECHSGCAIAKQVGTCVMPKEGIFCRVLKGGRVQPGDRFVVLSVPETKV
ncbi:MAG: MOSC domain-containing protein [Desulfovibrio sp.]|nr:MOSC domain-containing protein [Desulfovibrio sp.]